MKKVLYLCTGNSCRSIIAEALTNALIKGVEAKSSGIRANGTVHESAKKVLQINSVWDDKYHSKTMDKILLKEFDLVVTVCDNAKESCPVFPKRTQLLHVGFEDPDGKEFGAFEKCFKEIKTKLLPLVESKLCG